MLNKPYCDFFAVCFNRKSKKNQKLCVVLSVYNTQYITFTFLNLFSYGGHQSPPYSLCSPPAYSSVYYTLCRCCCLKHKTQHFRCCVAKICLLREQLPEKDSENRKHKRSPGYKLEKKKSTETLDVSKC